MSDHELLNLLEAPATTNPHASTNPHQGGADWLQARIGRLTASRFADACAVLKSGAPAKAQLDLLREIVAERMTDCAVHRHVNHAMQHGIEWEPAARAEYERVSGNAVELAGFVLHPTIEHLGASPDGFVGESGLVEIKCPTTATFLTWLQDGIVPIEHRPQMLIQLACTGRAWCDFFAYDPRIKVGPHYFIRRFNPTADEIAEAAQQAADFLKRVDDLFDAITQGAP